jgi:DNA-binding LytR/AlgR family response regulator
MTTAIIADDEEHLRAHLSDLLVQAWPELTIVAQCQNGLEAIEQINALRPDVAFLDIKMPGRTGIEVAQEIEGSTRVVFATAYDEFAVHAFECEAIDYLMKPVAADRLRQTVERLSTALVKQTNPDAQLLNAIRALASRDGTNSASELERLRWVRASKGDVTHQISVSDVLYFQSDDKYTVVHTPNGEYLIRTPIGELVTKLDPGEFCQVHRGTLINMSYVLSAQRDDGGRMQLQLLGHKTHVAVARPYQYLFKQM